MQVQTIAELVSLAERIGLGRLPDRRIRAIRLFSLPGNRLADRSGMQDNNLVLVVDDDPGMLKAVQRLLRQYAYEPILFSSRQAFKSHSDIEKAACVILDIDLPDGSGIELREDLKAAGVSVPVIYITGNANPKVREAAMASGCVAFLAKPFSSHELIEPLKKASAG